MKQMKCCCCPDCRVNPGKCCKCIPTTICVTFADAYGNQCSVELDWDKAERHFAGSLSCDGESHDLLFFFDSDEDGDDGYPHCYFKLRSDSLGFPEGYEHRWIVGEEIFCETLEAGVSFDDGSGLSIKAVRKITPTECRGCKCLCECLCVSAVSADGKFYIGKVCWPDDYSGGSDYCGTLKLGGTADDDTIDVCIRFLKRGEVCDPEEYDCDPYDESCVIALTVGAWGIENEWQDLDPDQPCEERNLSYSWDIPYKGSVSIGCATCNQVCERPRLTCADCNVDTLPLVLTAHITFVCDGETTEYTATLSYANIGLAHFGYCGAFNVINVETGLPEEWTIYLDLSSCAVNILCVQGCPASGAVETCIDGVPSSGFAQCITVNSCDPVDITAYKETSDPSSPSQDIFECKRCDIFASYTVVITE